MIQIDIGEMFLAFIAAMGIPSAIMGLIVWRLKGRIEEKEVAQAERTKAQQDLFLIIVQSTRASIALGEATAKAVQRIPDTRIATEICTPPWSMRPVSSTSRKNF